MALISVSWLFFDCATYSYKTLSQLIKSFSLIWSSNTDGSLTMEIFGVLLVSFNFFFISALDLLRTNIDGPEKVATDVQIFFTWVLMKLSWRFPEWMMIMSFQTRRTQRHLFPSSRSPFCYLSLFIQPVQANGFLFPWLDGERWTRPERYCC
jgi:hypothetical protein